MLGVTGGVAIPGNQDLIFTEYPQDGGAPATSRIIGQDRVDESLGPLAGFTLTAWGDRSFLRYLALQFEPIYWYMQAKGAASPPAPRFTVHEHRLAILFSGLARLRVEARWLFVSDVDTTPRNGPGWRVDVSSNQGPRPFGRHHDTQFYPVLLGLDWTF